MWKGPALGWAWGTSFSLQGSGTHEEKEKGLAMKISLELG